MSHLCAGYTREIGRCDAEIARFLNHLRAADCDEQGAYLGLKDWRSERRLLLSELSELCRWEDDGGREDL